jgi:hypothetical protein
LVFLGFCGFLLSSMNSLPDRIVAQEIPNRKG